MRKVREEQAVSEVVGTILILGITIVLFAAVFVYVQQFPLATPSEQVTIYSEITYNPNSHILFENLTDKAGSILLRSESSLVILINDNEYSNLLSSLHISSPYKNSSNYLEPGDTITWNSSSTGSPVSSNSTVNSMLIYKPSNQILWQSRNSLSNQVAITAFYVTPSPMKANESYTIVVQVHTYDPNATVVHLNLTSLYGINLNTTMDLYSVSGNTASFYYLGTSPASIPAYSVAIVFANSGGSTLTSEIDIS